MFWALVGTIDTVSIILSMEGHVRTYTSTSGLFSALSYIIRITDAHEQALNSAAVPTKHRPVPVCINKDEAVI